VDTMECYIRSGFNEEIVNRRAGLVYVLLDVLLLSLSMYSCTMLAHLTTSMTMKLWGLCPIVTLLMSTNSRGHYGVPCGVTFWFWFSIARAYHGGSW
jgi:hypothetical protein